MKKQRKSSARFRSNLRESDTVLKLKQSYQKESLRFDLKMNLKAGSLFAGIGGFCLGLKHLGIETAWAVENDQAAVATYRKNFPGNRIISDSNGPKSVTEVDVTKDELEPVDILHAGFPCQSFSGAGERKGFADPRGKLFYEIIRIINEFGKLRPSVIILENSPFLRLGEGGEWFLEISKELKKAGYWFGNNNAIEIDSYRHTNLPQKRNRLFMLAFNYDKFKNGRFKPIFPEVTSEKNLSHFIDYSGNIGDEYYLSPENRYHKMISERFIDNKRLYQLRKYMVRVKEPNECPTLTANMGLGGHNVPFVFDNKGLRKLTEYECLKLQGFPNWFEFPNEVTTTRRYQQVGNSVVPAVVEILGKIVIEKIQTERYE